MNPVEDVIAKAVRDELYARALFDTLIGQPTHVIRFTIENDPDAQTEFMARHLLDYRQNNFDSIPNRYSLELLEIARIAARDGEPHVRCRVEKDFGVVSGYLGRFADAQAALRCAASFARQTHAQKVHGAIVDYARAIVCDVMDDLDGAKRYADRAIETFEECGASDRAYTVCEFDAFCHARRGASAHGLLAYAEVIRRAEKAQSKIDIARGYYNMGHCYRDLNDLIAARRFFMKSARVHRAIGNAVLEARAARCAVRATIRMHGTEAVSEMDFVKNLFLAVGAAGEVCRSTIAIMQELLPDAGTDFRPYCVQIEEDARALGILAPAAETIHRLSAAAQNNTVTDHLLQEAWDAFGRSWAISDISGAMTVRH